MSWIATKYAWKCTNPLVKGSVRLVLLAIALRVEKQKLKTTPTSLAQLERLTLLDERQIRRCLNLLCSSKVGEVERLTRGKRAVYALPKLAGPLFVCDAPEKADKMTGFYIPPQREKSGQDDRFSRKQSGHLDRKKADNLSGCANPSPFSDLVRTKDLSTTATEQPAAAAAVESFLDWFITEYPKHRAGVLYTIAPSTAEPIVLELLKGRSLERLQTMAMLMWSERHDAWVARSDYGLHVLKHRASQFENQAITQERRAAATPARTPPTRDDIVARTIAQLERGVDETLLGRARAHAIIGLTNGNRDGAALDAILLAVARQEVGDLTALEAEARAELAAYKDRMPGRAHDQAIRAGVDRLLRQRANLPDLRELPPIAERNEATA